MKILVLQISTVFTKREPDNLLGVLKIKGLITILIALPDSQFLPLMLLAQY